MRVGVYVLVAELEEGDSARTRTREISRTPRIRLALMNERPPPSSRVLSRTRSHSHALAQTPVAQLPFQGRLLDHYLTLTHSPSLRSRSHSEARLPTRGVSCLIRMMGSYWSFVGVALALVRRAPRRPLFASGTGSAPVNAAWPPSLREPTRCAIRLPN